MSSLHFELPFAQVRFGNNQIVSLPIFAGCFVLNSLELFRVSLRAGMF